MEKKLTISNIHSITQLLLHQPHLALCIDVIENTKNKRILSILELVKKHGIGINFLKPEKHKGDKYDKSKSNQKNISCTIKNPQLKNSTELNQFIKLVSSQKSPLFLALENITDTGNLGACLRAALGFGVDGVILLKDNCATINEIVIDRSVGAVFSLNIFQINNFNQLIKNLKQENIWFFATSDKAKQSIYQADFKLPTCLIMGSEEKGVSDLVIKNSDFFVKIPMSDKLDSLNLGSATSVILSEISRQRKAFD